MRAERSNPEGRKGSLDCFVASLLAKTSESAKTSSMIGILIFPDFQLLDAAGPISVFEIAARYAGLSPSIKTLAVAPGPVRSSSGVEMLARSLKPSGAISTLMIAGGEGVDAAARCERTLNFVRAIAKRGVRVASVCSGAYVLAEAGLLDGRRATTHWEECGLLAARYPAAKVDPGVLFTDEDGILTSRTTAPLERPTQHDHSEKIRFHRRLGPRHGRNGSPPWPMTGSCSRRPARRARMTTRCGCWCRSCNGAA